MARLDDGAGAGSLEETAGAGALDEDELARTEERADEASEAIDETAELTADSTDEDGAIDELELDTTELDTDGSTGVTGVGVGRLKIQMRPMMTSAATMTIIQVLRFISY